MKRFLLYLLRWQLSTPILALILYFLSNISVIGSTIIANLVGGCLFYWVDKYLFTHTDNTTNSKIKVRESSILEAQNDEFEYGHNINYKTDGDNETV